MEISSKSVIFSPKLPANDNFPKVLELSGSLMEQDGAHLKEPINPLKIHSHPKIDPPSRQVIRNSVLRIFNGFDPGIGSLIGYFHQVEHLQARPGISGEAQEMIRTPAAPGLFPQLKTETDVDPVVGREPVGISVNDVVIKHPERQSGTHCQVEVHTDIFIFAEVILKKHGHGE